MKTEWTAPNSPPRSPPPPRSSAAPCSTAASATAPAAPPAPKAPAIPSEVLTVTYPGGRTKQISLSAEQKPLVQQWLRNYRKLRDTLERICELNLQLLRPENHA